MIKVFVRDAVARGLFKERDRVPVKAGTRVTVVSMVPDANGRIRFSQGSEPLEMTAKAFVKATKDRD
jgi:hypothetical protein